MQKGLNRIRQMIKHDCGNPRYSKVCRPVDGKPTGGQFVGRGVADRSIDSERHIRTSSSEHFRVSKQCGNECRGVIVKLGYREVVRPEDDDQRSGEDRG